MKNSARALNGDNSSSPNRQVLLLTCEHGGATVPATYAHLFVHGAAALASHRGFDPGALPLARTMARALCAPLYYSRTSRLLVELNRSPRHPALFSEFTRGLDAETREDLLRRYYRPHRLAVEAAIAGYIQKGLRVIHIGVHSFTPALDGIERNTDVGLLYDPARQLEKTFCTAWSEALRALHPALRVRRNYPYRGAADGFTTYLRSRFAARHYCGIELEVNNQRLIGGAETRRTTHRVLVDTLKLVLQ